MMLLLLYYPSDNICLTNYQIVNIMTLSDFFKTQGIGSQIKMSEALGIAAPHLSLYATGKRQVPVIVCVDIERYTGGKVSRRDLRPNDFQKIWPELSV